MQWRGRGRELALAGGTVALAATVGGCFPVCNANPDPCCRDQKSDACAAWNACVAADGGFDACYYNRDLSAPISAPEDLSSVRGGGGHD